MLILNITKVYCFLTLLIEVEEQIGILYNGNKNNDIDQFITDFLYIILFHL